MFNIETFKTAGIKTMHRSILILRKHSPGILTTVGIAGMVGTAVLASRATLKLHPILHEIRTQKFDLDHYAFDAVNNNSFDEKEHNKAVAKVYLHGAVDISKLYGPTITLGLSSIACIIAAHGIMNRRAVALTAAYKALESTFAEYRNRVIEQIGEKREEDIRMGTKTVEITDENGKTKKITSVDPNGISPYAKFFDEHSDNWSKTPEYNLLFLKAQQNYANDLLHARGHVFLNEVYDMIGVPRTSAGQVVGWVISKDGDNFIDFGIYDHWNNEKHLFVNGLEASILLDFNVDGVVYDRI